MVIFMAQLIISQKSKLYNRYPKYIDGDIYGTVENFIGKIKSYSTDTLNI